MPVTNYLWDPVDDVILEEYDDEGRTIVSYTREPGYHGKLIFHHRDGNPANTTTTGKGTPEH